MIVRKDQSRSCKGLCLPRCLLDALVEAVMDPLRSDHRRCNFWSMLLLLLTRGASEAQIHLSYPFHPFLPIRLSIVAQVDSILKALTRDNIKNKDIDLGLPSSHPARLLLTARPLGSNSIFASRRERRPGRRRAILIRNGHTDID